MFNTEISVTNQENSQTVNNNNYEVCTGQLTKISKTSKIIRFQKGSQSEKDFFCDEPFIRKKRTVYYKGDKYCVTGLEDSYEIEDKYNIDILQVLIFGDNQFLVEYEIKNKQ